MLDDSRGRRPIQRRCGTAARRADAGSPDPGRPLPGLAALRHHVPRHSVNEVATVLGLSRDMVYRRLKHSLAQLKKLLDQPES
jgi:hypothetical protein